MKGEHNTHGTSFVVHNQMPVKINKKKFSVNYLLSPLSVSLSHSFPPFPKLLASPRLTFPFFLLLIYFFLLHYLTDISSSFKHVMPIFTLVLAILHNVNGFKTILLTCCYHAVPLAQTFLPS